MYRSFFMVPSAISLATSSRNRIILLASFVSPKFPCNYWICIFNYVILCLSASPSGWADKHKEANSRFPKFCVSAQENAIYA